MNLRLKAIVLGTASSLVLGVQAHAAVAPAQEGNVLEELVVTAQRREESIQAVPASITAFGQQAIQKLAITNVEDITRMTPGLSIARGDGLSGSSNIAIRGIASFVGTATTAIYIDDTPTQVRFLGAAEAAGTSYPTVFDLERIEVLRGPQGTLFGASSEGGTIRFLTPRPGLGAWSGHARAEISSVQDGDLGYQVGVAGGGAIVPDKLGLRISAYAERNGGWIDRVPFGGGASDKNGNDSEVQSVSVAMLWRATDELSITPSVFWQYRKAGGIPVFWRSLSNPGKGDYVSGNLTSQTSRDEFVLPALKVEWSHAGIDFISNTSYLDHSLHQERDYTFGIQEILTGDIFGPNAPTNSIDSNPQKQFTQELRAQSTAMDGRLKWVVGAFYQDIRQEAVQRAVAPQLPNLIQTLFHVPIELVFGEGLLPGGVSYLGLDSSRDTQLAGFAQFDFNLTPELTLTAGIRQAHSKFSFHNSQDGPFNGGPTSGAGRSSEDDTLPKFGVTYAPHDHLRFYASAAKGFRPGGANVPVPAICGPDLALVGAGSNPAVYQSDTVWSYEAGSKGELAGNRLVWDASVFYVSWKGIQSSVYLPRCGFHFIANLGEAESKGFDLQARAQLATGLTADLSVGYTDASYTSTVPGVAGNLVTKGEALDTAPWHVMLAVDYAADERWGGTPYVHVDNTFSSGFRTSDPADALYNPDTNRSRAVNILNGRIGFKRNGLDVSLFAKNLLNTHPITFTSHTIGSSSYLDSTVTPRTVGVTLTKSF